MFECQMKSKTKASVQDPDVKNDLNYEKDLLAHLKATHSLSCVVLLLIALQRQRCNKESLYQLLDRILDQYDGIIIASCLINYCI